MRIALVLSALFLVQQDDVDRRVQRLKDRLKLSDEQAEKVREILKADREAQQKLEKEREEKVRDVLTDEQKQSYEQMRKGRVERVERPGDAEQAQKALEEARKRMEELREKGLEGLKGLDQFFKFEGLDNLPEGFRVFRSGDEGGRSPEERVKGAMDALKIEDEKEAEVVRGLVKKVVEAQKAMEGHERDSRKAVDEMAKDGSLSEEQLQEKLGALRAKRKELDGAVKDAQKELSEVVTYRQELELIKRKILR
jgi:ABC-type nitrate/sulfonate/bicarbonate transport system substrate-binding protein